MLACGLQAVCWEALWGREACLEVFLPPSPSPWTQPGACLHAVPPVCWTAWRGSLPSNLSASSPPMSNYHTNSWHLHDELQSPSSCLIQLRTQGGQRIGTIPLLLQTGNRAGKGGLWAVSSIKWDLRSQHFPVTSCCHTISVSLLRTRSCRRT